jgi:hypothetical protein
MKPRHPALFLAALTCCAAPDQHCRAQEKPQLLVFKDGFTLQGRIKQSTTSIGDPGARPIPVPTAGKPQWLDDGVRLVWFSPSQLADAWSKDLSDEEPRVKFDQPAFKTGGTMLGQWRVEPSPAWGKDGKRTLTLAYPVGYAEKTTAVTQRISLLTPDTISAACKEFQWTARYKTKEFDPAVIRDLVFEFAKKKEEFKGKPLDQRGEVFKFLVQAGFLDAADKELDQMMKDFPNEKSKIEPLREDVKRARARAFVEALERADKAGLHAIVAAYLVQYTRSECDKVLTEKAQLHVQAIRKKQEATAQKLQEAKRLLDGFAAKASANTQKFYKVAGKAIFDELGPDNVGRLETFLSQAQDYERALEDNRKPVQSADEVLAFAVTG